MRRHKESNLQTQCVTWARLQYPILNKLLFAIPNGGKRSAIEAAIMKGEGVTPGVSDLLLSLPAEIDGKTYHGFYIEMKFGKGKQSDHQKEFEVAVTEVGYLYMPIWTFDDFRLAVKIYMESTFYHKRVKNNVKFPTTG